MNALELPQVTWAGLSLGLLAIGIGAVLGWTLRQLVKRLLLARGRGPASAGVFARLTNWLVLALGVLAALTIVFPSVRPVDILGGVGVVSIAAGIAFQTVLGNMFAGIVLLARDRFRVGDQIQIQEHRGTLVHMGLSSSSMRTFDGRLVLIPNALLHSKVVTVQTGFQQVRTTVTVDLSADADLAEACRLAEDEMRAEALVLDDPAPQALLSSIGTSTVTVELRFWSGALQLETKQATHQVISRVLAAFERCKIKTASSAVVVEAGPDLAELLESGLPRSGSEQAERPVGSSHPAQPHPGPQTLGQQTSGQQHPGQH